MAHREVRAAGVLEGDRHGVVVAFADIIEREVRALPGDPGVDRRLLALALAGAVNELLVDWTASNPRPPTTPLIATLTRLFVAALR